MSKRDRGGYANVAIAGILVVLLVLTLAPSDSGTIEFRDFCLICGNRGLADAILNVVLFLPLGLALGARFRSNVLAYTVAIALSTGIELIQVVIPGRDSSPADVLFNGLGSVLGVGLARSWRLWLLPGRKSARRLAFVACVAAVLSFISTDLLLRPDFPETQYDAAWTPRLRHVPQYEGSVLEFTLAGSSVPNGLIADSRAVREHLESGAPLRALVVAGAPPDGRAPVVEINGFQSSLVSLGIERFDLLFRYRVTADAVRLDRPELRLHNALLGVRPGEVFEVRADSDRRARCLSAGGRRECGLGFTLGDGWSLLLWSESFPAWLTSLLGLAWMAGLALPLAFWAPTRRLALILTAVVAAAAFQVPRTGLLLTTPWYEMAAVAAGSGLGMALAAMVGRDRS